jgi:hypothetical protein
MKITTSLFAVAAALFFAPLTASAEPNDCADVCSFTGSCRWLCTDGSVRTNCGAYGVCAGAALQAEPSEPQASAEQAAAAETEEAVCRAPSAEAQG